LTFQQPGIATEFITPKTKDDVIVNWANAIKEIVKAQTKEAGWMNKRICVILCIPFAEDGNDMILLALELKKINLGVQVFFEGETLSQEWPIVIICSM